jgi:hypothetical protein
MTTTLPPPLNPDELLTRALSVLPRAELPADLADRAFAAAMQAPPVSTWADAIYEVFQVARIGAVCAASIAAVLAVGAATRGAAPAEDAPVIANDDAEWIAAVLPGLGAHR